MGWTEFMARWQRLTVRRREQQSERTWQEFRARSAAERQRGHHS